jgi:hypothetical protein
MRKEEKYNLFSFFKCSMTEIFLNLLFLKIIFYDEKKITDLPQ